MLVQTDRATHNLIVLGSRCYVSSIDWRSIKQVSTVY